MTYTDRLSELNTALARLKEALPQVQNQLDKDGTIKRFEFVFELLWKTLKDYAEDKGRLDASSPKDAFRVAADLGLIDNPQIWFDFLKNRNSADEVYSQIPSFVTAADLLISKLSV